MPTLVQKIFHKLVYVEPQEIRAVLTSFIFVFTLMAAYFILRPVRDAMSSDWTDAELSWLWTANFFISAIAVFLYGIAVSKIKLKHLVPGVYGFFATSFLLFYILAQTLDSTQYIDKVFYVWVSFFALFHVSVFWSFMSDMFSKTQSKRLFGFIAAGASIGAMVGPSIPTFFSELIGVYNLLLISALMLFCIIPLIPYLEKIKIEELHNTDVQADLGQYAIVGGDFYQGFIDFFTNRYLLGIGLFILLYTTMSTFIYYELKNMLAEFDRATRSQYWGMMDLIVNTLAIFTAMLATSRLATKFGLAITLALIPVLMVLGWLAVAFTPVLTLLIGLQIVRRAGNYAITKPGREMLFTTVNRETRFKTKPVIDIVVYRGGDMLTGWTYTALAQGLGLGLGAIALIGASIAIVWTFVALFIGALYEKVAENTK